MMNEIREDKQDLGLINKYGKCNYCNGRGYLGTFINGMNCRVCHGTGANHPTDEQDVIDEFDNYAETTRRESYTTYDEIAETRALLVHLLGVRK